MCHAFKNGTLENMSKFQELADKVSGTAVTDLGAFANQYLEVFSKGYNYAFGIAALAMVVSLSVYVIFNRLLPTVQKVKVADSEKPKATTNLVSLLLAGGLMITTSVIFYLAMGDLALGAAVGLFIGFVAMMFMISTKEERPRVTSLLLVFFVVIFFWMSFHQNGLTLTFFARDYTVKEVGPFTNIFFNLGSMLAFIGTVAGVVMLFNKKRVIKLIGLGMFLVLGAVTWWLVSGWGPKNPIAPEVFQSFNPLFIVSLTFPVMGIFTWLRNRNQEPSTPKKIGIGMIIASFGLLIILVASIGLV